MSETRTTSRFLKSDSMRTKRSMMINFEAAEKSSEAEIHHLHHHHHNHHARSARTLLKNSKTICSMSPLMDALPETPSAVGSGGSLSPLSSSATFGKADSFFSDLPSTDGISTPTRNQGTICGLEVKEGMGMMSSKDLGRLCGPNSQTNMNPKGSCLSKLSMRVQPEFLGSNGDVAGGYPSEREEISVDNEEYKNVASADQSSYEGSDGGRSDGIGRDKPMDRPKPYHEFLDEVQKQELQAEIEAWRKAEHMRLVDKLRREEGAIDDWEFKQTSKALKEIKKLESKLEKKREKAVQKTWKTISTAKEEARKERMKVRRSAMGKISSVSLSETYDHERANSKSTKKFMLSWHKITAYCKSLYLKSVRCTVPKSQLRPS